VQIVNEAFCSKRETVPTHKHETFVISCDA